MAVEPLWTSRELSNISGALSNLEEFLQGWEQDYDVKVADLMLNIETLSRDPRRLGLISQNDKDNTTLQFEAIDAEIGLA